MITDVDISHDSVVSLHVQLHNQLRQLILSGRWTNGTRIPSETQFAEAFKLSRSTVRLALQQAEIEGLIERIAGRGTFVAYSRSRSRNKRLIAFVTCDFDAENHLLLLNGAESEAKARDYQIVFSKVTNYEEERATLKRLSEYDDTAGILLWPNTAHSHPENVGDLPTGVVPVVFLDRRVEGSNLDCVTSDNYGGAQSLMRHLVELGHQHVVFLCHHEMRISTVMERYRAYQDVLREADLMPMEPWLVGLPGLEPNVKDVLRSSLNSRSLELQSIKKYMSSAHPRPTAIFAVNDYMAILAMRAMKLLNLHVPDDVSIAGFDGHDLAAQLEVPLTTVAQDPFGIGKRAAQILIDRIEGNTEPTRFDLMPTELYVRTSTSVPVSAKARS